MCWPDVNNPASSTSFPSRRSALARNSEGDMAMGIVLTLMWAAERPFSDAELRAEVARSCHAMLVKKP